MNTAEWFALLQNGAAAGLLTDLAIKGFAVLACAAAVSLLVRRASAASRFWLWFLALATLLIIPVLSVTGPKWQKPLWAVSANPRSGNELELRLELVPRAETGTRESTMAEETRAPAENGVKAVGRFGMGIPRTWLATVCFVWLAGVCILVARQLLSVVQLQALRRRCFPAPESATALVQALEKDLGMRQRVTLLQSSDAVMPITWGCVRPVILLPCDIVDWPIDRLRVVLLHELAHVKRGDYLTQTIAALACALHWFNPLAWHGARVMRNTRELACDDLVLNRGCKPSDYAAHLVMIATSLRGETQRAGIAMARPSRLQQRVVAITDETRTRRAPRALAVGLWFLAALVLAGTIAAQKAGPAAAAESQRLRTKLFDQVRAFSKQKHQHSLESAAAAREEMKPEFAAFFKAAEAGDYQTVTNLYAAFKRRHPQYQKTAETDDTLWVSYWQQTLEVCLAWFDVSEGEPKYVQMAVDGFMNQVPAGAVYFGGTDPGRGLPTAFSKNHAAADPFFVLSQNPLASGPYMDYLRGLYGSRLTIPSSNDITTAFEAYREDAVARMEKGQLRPGEEVKKDAEGKVTVAGQVAVMAINARIAKQIFDKNPDKEFYVEESFPLDWMYPRLEPAGQIMKINREPLTTLPDSVIARDREYWSRRVDSMLGSWLRPETSVATVAQFAEKVYGAKDLSGFRGDPFFVQGWWAQKAFSKWRSSIGGVYSWRAMNAPNAAERKRMADAADFAFRQAYAMCPSSPEALYRYVNQLAGERRFADAILLAEATLKVEPNAQTRRLVEELKRLSTADNAQPEKR